MQYKISGNYKKLRCIQKMKEMDEELGPEYFNAFTQLVDYYAPKLPSRIVQDGSAFTTHDFENHCYNIYKVVGKVLLSDSAFSEKGLTIRELYILNLAILFHDIGMTQTLDGNRKNHAKEAAEYLSFQYCVITTSKLRQVSGLNTEEFEALRLIVKAHSNTKDGSVTPEENGLRDPELKKMRRDIFGNEIRTLLLAGILRIADELDVSADRLNGNPEIEEEIKAGQQKFISLSDTYGKKYENITSSSGPQVNDDMDIYEKWYIRWISYFESLKHWKRLHYIRSTETKRNTICLKVNDEYIRREVEWKRDPAKEYEEIAKELLAVAGEIQKKLDEAWKLAFEPYADYIQVNKVQIVTEIQELSAELS